MRSTGFVDQQQHAVLLVGLLFAVLAGLFAGFTTTSRHNSRQAAAPLTASSETPEVTVPPATPPATGTAADGIEPMPTEGIWSQVQTARLLQQIAPGVASARGLTAVREIPLSFLEEPDMTALLLRLYAEQDVESQFLPYASLGLIDQQAFSLEVGPATAVYVPADRQLYVSSAQPLDDHRLPTLLAHAYASALRDQHFGLETTDIVTGTIDQALAARAVAAGDAMLATALYRYGDLLSADWSHLADLIIEEQRAHSVAELPGSEVWERLREFPHREGRRFVQHLFESGGWDAVNRAYVDPPRSTQEILCPDRYLEQRDEPIAADVPALSDGLGSTWRLVREETLGAFLLSVYLDDVRPQETGPSAVAAWAGDTFVVWEREDGTQAIVWHILLETIGDAARLAESFMDAVAEHNPGLRATASPQGVTGRWWESETETVHVSRSGRYVLLVRAPDIDTAADIARAMPVETGTGGRDLETQPTPD